VLEAAVATTAVLASPPLVLFPSAAFVADGIIVDIDDAVDAIDDMVDIVVLGVVDVAVEDVMVVIVVAVVVVIDAVVAVAAVVVAVGVVVAAVRVRDEVAAVVAAVVVVGKRTQTGAMWTPCFAPAAAGGMYTRLCMLSLKQPCVVISGCGSWKLAPGKSSLAAD